MLQKSGKYWLKYANQQNFIDKKKYQPTLR